MFNLTESFKNKYKDYLQEKALASDYEKSLKEYEEAQKYINEGFEVISSYFNSFSILQEASGKPRENEDEEDSAKPTEKKANAEVERKVAETLGNVFSFLSRGESPKDQLSDYQPVIGHARVEKISEMRFPENVIFFFQQLISWIVNLVKKFISFFTNALRRLFLIPEGPKFEESMELSLQRAKKIESIAMPLSNKKDYTSKRNLPAAVSLVGFDTSDWEKVRNIILKEAGGEGEYKDPGSTLDMTQKGLKAETSQSGQIMAIDINVSKEMEGIHQLLQYFLDLFDNSYGSNREHLFGTDDLEMLLQLFKETIKEMSEGSVSTTAISGKLTSMQLLSASKLKDNLIRTKVNTDNLKRVYVEIEQNISNMLTVLSHKQLVASENLGVSYRFYSASTYVQMIKILNALKPRVKQAEEMEKDLKKMQAVFDKIVVQLGKQRQVLLGFGEVTYTSIYQKKIAELFDGARYVSQTISLRLATLGLFIRQLKDIREAIYNVNSINERNKGFLTSKAFQF
jgi:hypothetical protein